MKVALFDDENHWRTSLSFILEDEGFEVRAFDSIDDAAVREACAFDIVISDFKFSHASTNGLDFLTRLRSQGFAGGLILYSNSILDAYRQVAKRHRIMLAAKSEKIEGVVRGLLAAA